jgi:hypothetical protein
MICTGHGVLVGGEMKVETMGKDKGTGEIKINTISV